jgi:uncharacterized protein involved in exopolysaccharide biosynthesis
MVSANDEIESDAERPFDLKLVTNLLGYAAGSFHRHAGLAVTLFVVLFGSTVSSLFLLSKTYHVETKLLAQKNLALAIKGDNANEEPSRAAAETVMRRDNLVAIIHQTDLLHEWYAHRAPLPHLKDVIVKAVAKPETEQETIAWMADVLQKRMNVGTPNEGIVEIALDWPDPVMALRLVDAAQQNYLDARHAIEITAVAEQVAILQSHSVALRVDIDSAVTAIEKLRAERLAKPEGTPIPAAPSAETSAPPPTMAPAPRRPTEPDPELAQLKTAIEAKQQAIKDLEEFRRRRLSELNASLAEKSATYTDNHPVIIDLRQTIASLSTEAPEVQSLRADVDKLRREFDEKNAVAAAESRSAPMMNTGGGFVATPPPLPGSIIRIEQEPADDRDPAMMYARSRLRDAMEKYSNLRAQIEVAQIDVDTAEAAFKYRYSVIDPPLYPKGPTKPNPFLVVGAGLIASLLVALFVAVAADVRKGRFLAEWQVERLLDLPTLAQIDLATIAEHEIE